MKLQEVIEELKARIDEKTKKTFIKHCDSDNIWGVKVADLKILQKKIKKDNELAIELFDTGISEAMYLAALICEPKKLSKDIINSWAEKAFWYMISEYPVAWCAAESLYAIDLALEWIDSEKENISSSGWATLSSFITITNDEYLDLELFKKLLERAKKQIHNAPNRTKQAINGFVISCGISSLELNSFAKKCAAEIGEVNVNMGKTSCKTPNAIEYIEKAEKSGGLGKKRKTAFC